MKMYFIDSLEDKIGETINKFASCIFTLLMLMFRWLDQNIVYRQADLESIWPLGSCKLVQNKYPLLGMKINICSFPLKEWMEHKSRFKKIIWQKEMLAARIIHGNGRGPPYFGY